MSNEKVETCGISVLEGHVFKVVLDTQVGSTGYSWALAHMPDSVNLLEITYESSHSTICGSKESQIFTFSALKADKDTLKFNLVRPWEPQVIADTKVFPLKIEEPGDSGDNELLDIMGKGQFADINSCAGSWDAPITVLYMAPAAVKYMAPTAVKYMAPITVKYMAPPVVKYMAPIDPGEIKNKE
ncbi:chagasin family peptidase inhibitor I42 [Anaerobacterium chartisolvens]|uniref:Chagasin family peptidase inhibitor I42 n=1 Tax=Anaerobacterium chartisolvens TaxID=1297424 RepID=A0A369AXN3_9FIRM|nr:protease inhibitor I42 family protein [Anaerobacterium chartisolvens]RCX12976.1 chagasin family peptidase inhibitor I42 [Anaerobacterium chartisolvens]